MASPPRTAEREEERRLNVRTLAIASAAAAAAALITSRLWIAGTWIAAAMTPVIVTLVSELLHRPTERIARSLTHERTAVRPGTSTEPLPEAGGAAPPARPYADPLPTRAPQEPGAGAGRAEPPVTVYHSGSSGARPAGGPGRRRKIAYGAVFGTAALAFVIAVLAITVPELIAGGSIGKNDTRSTLFGGKKDQSDKQAPQDTTEEDQAQPEEDTDEPAAPTEPEQTTPEETPTEEETTPVPPPSGEPLPQTTTPAPPATP